MKKSIVAGCGLLLIAAFGTVQAANNWTSAYYEIKNVVFWSKSDPIYPQWQGYVSVEFTQPLVWGIPGICSTTTVAVRPADTHVISAVQTALASGRTVRLYVDDSQRIDGTNCILRALQY